MKKLLLPFALIIMSSLFIGCDEELDKELAQNAGTSIAVKDPVSLKKKEGDFCEDTASGGVSLIISGKVVVNSKDFNNKEFSFTTDEAASADFYVPCKNWTVRWGAGVIAFQNAGQYIQVGLMDDKCFVAREKNPLDIGLYYALSVQSNVQARDLVFKGSKEDLDKLNASASIVMTNIAGALKDNCNKISGGRVAEKVDIQIFDLQRTNGAFSSDKVKAGPGSSSSKAKGK